MNIIARQRLFLTADNAALVAGHDPKAAFLYCIAGDEIPEEAHERFGLKEGALPGFVSEEVDAEKFAAELAAKEVEEKAAAEPTAKEAEEKAAAEPTAKEAEEKAAAQSANKGGKQSENKGK
jgi:hypothetical protein